MRMGNIVLAMPASWQYPDGLLVLSSQITNKHPRVNDRIRLLYGQRAFTSPDGSRFEPRYHTPEEVLGNLVFNAEYARYEPGTFTLARLNELADRARPALGEFGLVYGRVPGWVDRQQLVFRVRMHWTKASPLVAAGGVQPGKKSWVFIRLGISQ